MELFSAFFTRMCFCWDKKLPGVKSISIETTQRVEATAAVVKW
jgi:hypothetical protein